MTVSILQNVIRKILRRGCLRCPSASVVLSKYPSRCAVCYTVVMGRCRYLTSVSVFGIFVGIFSSRFGIWYRYFKISRYRFGISVFQLVHFKGHG